MTPLAHEVHALVRAGDLEAAGRLLPREEPYPEPAGLLDHLRVQAPATPKLKSPVPSTP